jgi:hypothetical protein
MIKKIKAFLKHFEISAGWFSGEPFKLFSITIGRDDVDAGFILIFDIQIAKLLFMISYNL